MALREEEPYLQKNIYVVRYRVRYTLLISFCTPVPYLPLLAPVSSVCAEKKSRDSWRTQTQATKPTIVM